MSQLQRTELTLTHMSTHTKHLDPLMCAYVAHNMKPNLGSFVPLIHMDRGKFKNMEKALIG